MEKKEQLYEGKAKKVFATDDPDFCIVDYKDDATAFNGLKKGTISGKGVVNNKMSNYLFQFLESKDIPTHFVKQLSDRETLVKRVQIVPLEVIVRNKAAGSLAKRLWKRAHRSAALCWNSAIKAMNSVIQWSMRLTSLLPVLQQKKKLTRSQKWR